VKGTRCVLEHACHAPSPCEGADCVESSATARSEAGAAERTTVRSRGRLNCDGVGLTKPEDQKRDMGDTDRQSEPSLLRRWFSSAKGEDTEQRRELMRAEQERFHAAMKQTPEQRATDSARYELVRVCVSAWAWQVGCAVVRCGDRMVQCGAMKCVGARPSHQM
jgi:hypothetical protein